MGVHGVQRRAMGTCQQGRGRGRGRGCGGRCSLEIEAEVDEDKKEVEGMKNSRHQDEEVDE